MTEPYLKDGDKKLSSVTILWVQERPESWMQDSKPKKTYRMLSDRSVTDPKHHEPGCFRWTGYMVRRCYDQPLDNRRDWMNFWWDQYKHESKRWMGTFAGLMTKRQVSKDVFLSHAMRRCDEHFLMRLQLECFHEGISLKHHLLLDEELIDEEHLKAMRKEVMKNESD